MAETRQELEHPKQTPAAVIAVAWLIVSIPAAWGVYNTVLNARKLFAAPPPAAKQVPVPATAPATR